MTRTSQQRKLDQNPAKNKIRPNQSRIHLRSSAKVVNLSGEVKQSGQDIPPTPVTDNYVIMFPLRVTCNQIRGDSSCVGRRCVVPADSDMLPSVASQRASGTGAGVFRIHFVERE